MNTLGIGAEYRRKLAAVIQSSGALITPREVSNILEVTTQEAGRILARWRERKWLKRLKRGVYIVISAEDLTGDYATIDAWVVANYLFAPGYIAGFSAVKHWGFSEQIFEITTFFSTKKVNDCHPVVGSARFLVKSVAKHKLFGTATVWQDNHKLLISDPAKTIVDLLDDPALVGGMRMVHDIFIEYKNSEHFNLEHVLAYSLKMGNRTILKRLGFLMDYLGLQDLIVDWDLTSQISKGYSQFDPSMENPYFIRKWQLKIPKSWRSA